MNFKFILFFLILFINLISIVSSKKEFELDLLYKKHIQDELDEKERLLNQTQNNTNEFINLNKEQIIFKNNNQNLNINNIFENTTNLNNENLNNENLNNENRTINDLDELNNLTNQTNHSSILDYEEEKSLFELDDDQLLIDGYSIIDNEKSFLIEELINKLKDNKLIDVKIELICLPKQINCDQKILLIIIDRIVLKYELIRQNIFIDKSSKYYDYLNCFFIQYNPNFGLRSYLRNDLDFDFKKAFINSCFDNKTDLIFGKLYLTTEFKLLLKKHNSTTNIIQLKYDHISSKHQISLDKLNKLQTQKDNQIIKNLNNIYSIYSDSFNQSNLFSLNDLDCNLTDNYLNILNNILINKNLKTNKIKFLNQLNSTFFHNGLHQKLNKFKYLKAQLLFDSGILTVQEKENFKILNHLFQIIYETQIKFKQLNFYFVIVRLRFKLPNNLQIYSSTDHRMDINELLNEIKISNEDTYYELPSDFKLLFTSFKFYYQNSSNFLPSYSDGLINNPNSIAVIDYSYLLTNHWLLNYEIGHLLGLKDDNKQCKCLTDQCIMNASTIENHNELTWSNCSIKQLNSNLKLFNFNLPIKRTSFNLDLFNYSICGNGVLEPNESCDCGKFGCFFYNKINQTYEQNKCCNSTTCKLNSINNQCALGSCCDLTNCKFHDTDLICRPSKNICDIEEKCDGFSPYCPNDDYYVNGETCGLNRICINKKCIGYDNEFNCRNVLGNDAFESETCLKKNMVATDLFNCGYSFVDKRWLSCRSIEDSRCGSFQCAINRNSTDSIKLKLGDLFDLIKTGTSYNRSHECVLLTYKQNQHLLNKLESKPVYSLDGRLCNSNDDSLSNLKFCLNGKCKLNTEFDDYKTCLSESKCLVGQKCTHLNRCRCSANSKKSDFNFTGSIYCVRSRSLVDTKKERGLFDKFNFYHLLIIPCFAVILVLASFLRAYLRTGTYKIKDLSEEDEISVSFSGPRPTPLWCKTKI